MMQHLGDITKLNGATIEPVWCVTGGSPCQDLSIAGKRAGLAGARSGLFMEQIRVIKEMREHDKRLGRAGELIRPRYMVWENVPGAFSSNKGKDFATVLEEIIKIVEPEAPGIEVPEKGWPTWGATTMKWEDDGAWLGECMTRNTGESPNAVVESRLSQILEATPHMKYCLSARACQGILRRAARRGKDLPETLKQVLLMQSASGGGCDGGGKGALIQTEKSGTLGTSNDQTIFTPIPINLMVATRCKALGRGTGFGVGEPGDPANTISAAHSHGVFCAGFKAGQGAQAGGIGYGEEVSPTLAAAPSGTNQTPAVVALDMSHACDVIRECGEIAPSLQARMGTGGNQVPLTLDGSEVVSTLMERDYKGRGRCDTFGRIISTPIVRRLTPLECERLQGFPDGWTDIGDYTDSTGKKRKPSDSARYKALGNSIALPFWRWMFGRMAAYLPDGATLGSLFDGIGGFPLCWENIHGTGTAIWASEIEEFPIAVTKLRFGGAIT